MADEDRRRYLFVAVDGQTGDHILLAPPFIISDAKIDELVAKLSQAIETALAAA